MECFSVTAQTKLFSDRYGALSDSFSLATTASTKVLSDSATCVVEKQTLQAANLLPMMIIAGSLLLAQPQVSRTDAATRLVGSDCPVVATDRRQKNRSFSRLIFSRYQGNSRLLAFDEESISVAVQAGTRQGAAIDSQENDVSSIIQRAYEILASTGGYATLSYIARHMWVDAIELEQVLKSNPVFRRSYIPTPDGKPVFILNSRFGLLKDLWATFNFVNSQKVY